MHAKGNRYRHGNIVALVLVFLIGEDAMRPMGFSRSSFNTQRITSPKRKALFFSLSNTSLMSLIQRTKTQFGIAAIKTTGAKEFTGCGAVLFLRMSCMSFLEHAKWSKSMSHPGDGSTAFELLRRHLAFLPFLHLRADDLPLFPRGYRNEGISRPLPWWGRRSWCRSLVIVHLYPVFSFSPVFSKGVRDRSHR